MRHSPGSTSQGHGCTCLHTALNHLGWLAIALLLSAAALLPARAAPSDSAGQTAAAARIVFINSYHRGYSWSDAVEQALRDELARSGRATELSFEYLDSRRFGYGGQIPLIARTLAAKYRSYRPEVLVVCDNPAFEFAMQYREQLFPGVPMVFCGYNDFPPETARWLTNATGVTEATPIEDSVAMALKVHPGTHTLAFITSTTSSTNARVAQAAEFAIFPELRQRFDVVEIKDAPMARIRQRLAELPSSTLVFLAGQANERTNGRMITPDESSSLIAAASPFPVYAFWDSDLGHGVLGGHFVTAHQQGATAARMALRILDGTPADQIPVVMQAPTEDIFDARVMRRFGISAEQLPASARIIGQDTSVWATYRGQIIGIATLLALQGALIVLLLRQSRGRRKALSELDRERSLLEQHVTERTRALEAANTQLAHLSRTDKLTGLANRRHLDLVLETEFARLRRSGAPLSLIMIDIDYFKQFNDTYGHVTGDECLRTVGHLLARMVNRTPDLAARFGGEEFLIVLPETDAAGARALAEGLRQSIADLAIAHASSPVARHVTVSIGVLTVHPAAIDSVHSAVSQVDRHLYAAKQQGRNRVVASGEQGHQR